MDGEEIAMSTFVVYASKYGATQGIAERIAGRLAAPGQDVPVRSASAAGDVAGDDAFVIGSAAYMGSWRKEAVEFVRLNRSVLATRPVWLFSSGPLGTATTDAQGRDLLAVSEPRQFAEFAETVGPRALRVFFGALDPSRLRFADRLVRRMPAGRALLPEGEFGDWSAIDAWADRVASELGRLTATAR